MLIICYKWEGLTKLLVCIIDLYIWRVVLIDHLFLHFLIALDYAIIIQTSLNISPKSVIKIITFSLRGLCYLSHINLDNVEGVDVLWVTWFR